MSIKMSNLQNITYNSLTDVTTISSSNTHIFGNIAISSTLNVSTTIIHNGNAIMAMNTSAGHSIFIDPIHCQLYSGTAPGIIGEAITNTAAGIDANNGYCVYNIDPSQYNFWRAYVNLVSGTYLFRYNYGTSNNRGVLDLVINDVKVGSINNYSSTAVALLNESINNIVINSTGLYKVDLQVNSFVAPSNNYYLSWRGAALIRTS